jgi:hypothetical protein
VSFSRELVRHVDARDRLARLACLFSFVSHLMDTPRSAAEPATDGVDLLLNLAGEDEGPAVVLTALLLALGEKAAVDWRPGLAFVRVEIAREDLPRVPPHAGLLRRGGRDYLPLDPRRARSPLGFLPRLARHALRKSGA